MFGWTRHDIAPDAGAPISYGRPPVSLGGNRSTRVKEELGWWWFPPVFIIGLGFCRQALRFRDGVGARRTLFLRAKFLSSKLPCPTGNPAAEAGVSAARGGGDTRRGYQRGPPC